MATEDLCIIVLGPVSSALHYGRQLRYPAHREEKIIGRVQFINCGSFAFRHLGRGSTLYYECLAKSLSGIQLREEKRELDPY